MAKYQSRPSAHKKPGDKSGRSDGRPDRRSNRRLDGREGRFDNYSAERHSDRRHGGNPSKRPDKRTDSRFDSKDLIEGRRAVAEALSRKLPLKQAYVAASTSRERDRNLTEIVKLLESAHVPIEYVPRERLDGLSSHGAHQGIVVRAQPFTYTELSEIIDRADGENALVVVLDHVTDEGNFGAIVRSAEVVGAAGVVIPKARSVRVGTAAYKTSAGAVLHMPIAQVANLSKALEQLKQAGFWVVGSTEHASSAVWERPFPTRCALVMGSEGEGISRLVLEKCDLTFRLPQRGRVESLNVAQAATVMCYEWMRTTYGASGPDLPEMGR